MRIGLLFLLSLWVQEGFASSALRGRLQSQLRTWDVLAVSPINGGIQHVAVVCNDGPGQIQIFEATPNPLFEKVIERPLDKFLASYSNHQVNVLRAKEPALAKLASVDLCTIFRDKYRGSPYNFAMRWDHEETVWQDNQPVRKKAYYCSQLLFNLFEEANLPLVHINLRMQFVNADFAIAIIKSHNFEVPYGLPGVAPANFANDNFDNLGPLIDSDISRDYGLQQSYY